MTARARRTFCDAFKNQTVRMVTGGGVSLLQAARDLGVHVNLIRTCVQKATADAPSLASGVQSLNQDQADLVRLRKEVATLRMEQDILGHVLRTTSQRGRLESAAVPVMCRDGKWKSELHRRSRPTILMAHSVSRGRICLIAARRGLFPPHE